MRFGRSTGIILLVCMLMSGALAVPVAAATTYTDPQQRFSFMIPDGYTPTTAKLTPPVVAGFVAASPAGANFTVQVRDATGTLDAATAEFQNRYASGADSQPGPTGVTSLTLGGQPAQQFDYFTNAQGGRFHIAQVVAINGKALYILTFTAQEGDYDALIGQTRGVLASFAFLSAAANGPSAPISDGSTMYSDPQGRFSFTVPIDFQMTDPGDATVEFDARSPSGGLAAYFYLFVDKTDSSQVPSFNAAVASQRDFLITDRKYTIVSEQAISLSGSPAYRFDVTKTLDSGTPVRSAFIFAFNGGLSYQITYVSSPSRFGDYSGRLQALLSSFAFSATPNPITPPSAPSAPAKPSPPANPPPSNPPPAASPSPSPPPDGRDGA